MKKIAIVSGFYLPHLGGIEQHTRKIAALLKKNGYNVVIIASQHDPSLPLFETENNINIYRLPTLLPFRQRYPLFKKNRKYYQIINEIKKENIDFYILNTRFHHTSYLGAKLSKGKCMVLEHGTNHFTVHNHFLDQLGHIYEHYLTNRLKKKCHHYYGISKKANEWLSHFHIKSEGILYNIVEEPPLNSISKTKQNTITIMYAGRILKDKGIFLLIDTIKELTTEYPNICLKIAGSGPDSKKVKKKTQDNIIFMGVLPHHELMKELKETDIFVYPSQYPEGLPTAILEAGIMKCALITTDQGGIREVITNPNEGIIIEKKKSDLKWALTYLIENQAKRKKLQKNIYNRIKTTFSSNNIEEKWLEVIEQED